ncbi:hypothetical protein ABZ319_35355 [Nocardia sp. NPDC005978]|uniref:hypothetical protein n=1 Tax=Nocardia sp. NPDC005978 TaxID=3156725 RepID=UPI0033B8F714
MELILSAAVIAIATILAALRSAASSAAAHSAGTGRHRAAVSVDDIRARLAAEAERLLPAGRW